jgi:hypothetical protein
MKPHDPHHEIGDLLRSRKPDPRPSPGLEGRIMRALPERKSRAVWPWFALPPAIAMAVVMLLPEAPPPANHVAAGSPGGVAPESPPWEADLRTAANPLQREKLALQRDASRAGRFLIDCLPSLGSGE